MNIAVFEKMSEVQAGTLALVAWADGEFKQEEKVYFSSVVEQSPCSNEMKQKLLRHAEHPPVENDVLELVKNAPKEISVTCLKNAYMMARSDGEVAEEEIALIDKMAVAVGINSNEFGKLHKWLELSFACEVAENRLFKL